MDRADKAYFRNVIQPLLSRPNAEFIGEINDAQKAGFLSGARGLLFPIDWSEPFGPVMIEAMACGTPVSAFDRGLVPEVIAHGATGYIVDDAPAAVDAVARLDALSVPNPGCLPAPLHLDDHGAALGDHLYRTRSDSATTRFASGRSKLTRR